MRAKKYVINLLVGLLMVAVLLSYALGFLFLIFWARPYWSAGLYLLYAAAGLLSLPLLLALFHLASLRWGRLKVFISYKHHFIKDVEKLKKGLEARNVEVRYINFEPRYHDNTIQEVQASLRWMDAMVVIPDAERSSFVDAEIMGASLLKKPLVILRHTPEQILPTTAFSGYPVMDLEHLRRQSYIPLVDYFQFVRNHHRDYFSSMRRFLSELWESLKDIWDDIKENWWLVFAILGMLILRRQIKAAWVDNIVLTLGGGVVLLGIVSILLTLIRKNKAIRAARQTLLTGDATQSYLFGALDFGITRDKAILDAIERESLKIGHGKGEAASEGRTDH